MRLEPLLRSGTTESLFKHLFVHLPIFNRPLSSKAVHAINRTGDGFEPTDLHMFDLTQTAIITSHFLCGVWKD